MEKRKLLNKVKDLLPLIFIILAAVLSRVLPHPPNFAPITGIALFSGSYLSGFSMFILPLSIMFLSDLILGFHTTMFYVYLGFVVIVLLGKLLGKNKSLLRLTAISLTASLIFYLITNFGVWLSAEMYPKNLPGLELSYIMGLPFLRNTILGDIFYTFVLFYGFSFILNFLQNFLLSKKSA